MNLSHVLLEDLQEYGQEIRATMWQFTGIPVSVGIATTKTLTKIATEIVKKQPEYLGVLSIAHRSEAELDELLEGIGVEDVWGIGHRHAAALRARDIYTARDLKYADPHWMRRHFTVVGARTVLELRGIACIPLETKAKPKKGIMSSKSCSNIESPRLPRVLLKTHVMVTASPVVQMTYTPKPIRWPTKPVPTTDSAYWGHDIFSSQNPR